MSEFLQYIPEILTGIASILALWFTYNQHTKNKLIDYKIEKWKKQETEHNAKKAGNISIIYGELWELLYFLKADRVYLIQPHPLYRELYISATLEVKKYGVSSIRDGLNEIKIESISKFVQDLAKIDFRFIRDIRNEQEIPDSKMRSILTSNGCHSIAIRRLVDEENNWIGSIAVGYIHGYEDQVDQQLIEKMTRSSALSIQYILPEYNPE